VSLAPHRGIAADGEQSLHDLYEERVPLYERYGEIVIDCDDATPDEIVETIATQVS
jgi:shikimate kinase